MASIRTRRRRDGSRSFQVREAGVQTRTFDRHADAKRYKIEVERAKALGALYEAPPESFGAFLRAWIERKETAGRRASTLSSLRETAARLEPLSGRAIPELRRAEVEDLLSAIAAVAPRRAQMATALVKAVLRSAQERGQRVDERLFGLQRPRYDEREPRFLTVPQMLTLATWMPEYVRRIVPVAGLTGMRQGELLALEDRDVDLEAKALSVRRSKTRAGVRRIPLAEELVTLMREQLLARPNGTPLVFPTPTGLRWDRSRFMHRVFRPALLAAALDELGEKRAGSTTFGDVELTKDGTAKLAGGPHFHDLRHSAVSIMAIAGWRFEHVAQQVGWEPGSWPAMWSRYRHIFDGEIESETAKLDAFVRGVDATWTAGAES